MLAKSRPTAYSGQATTPKGSGTLPDVTIFKAYDIRGLVPEQLGAADAHRIGRAVARFLDAGPVCIGRDARSSSPELCDSLVRGITEWGRDVVDIGWVSTPMLYHAVVATGAAGGVMVTASHNPAAYNGFKICGPNAVPIGEASGLREVEKLADENLDPPAGRAAGSVAHRDVAETYADQALSIASPRTRRRIVFDAGNGMAAAALDPVLARLDLDVRRLYYEPDGTFPNHPADPLRAENLVDLQRAVVAEGAELGVAFDGDADRAIFVDEHGEAVSCDLATGLLARALLARSPGETVLYDLRSSWATGEEIRAAGGVAEMCRVGHSFVKAQMRESGALFAGELSGHFYFRFPNGLIADDAVAAVVCLLDVLESGASLSSLIAPLRRYSATGELNRSVDDPQAVIEAVAEEHRDAPEVSRLDGLLVRYEDWWFNLRPSNTEPVLRLNLEARDPERMRVERDRLLARMDGAASDS